MANKRDYYETLGVAKGASADDIKKQYRKMAMQFHPDRNPGDKAAEDKFKEAAEAYDVLSNADKKAKYDRFGHQGMGGASGGGQGAGMNMDDIFSQFGDVFGDNSPFESFFGGGRRQQTRRAGGQAGSNLLIKVKLTLLEISEGAKKVIKVKKQIACNTCHATGAKDGTSVSSCGTCNGTGTVRQITQTFIGQMQTTRPCGTCNGSGRSITHKCTSCAGQGRHAGEETITIDIPAGATEGIQLSMNGKGNAGCNNGPAGDLIINIEEVPHESLKREGNHVVYDLYLNIADAALGTQAEVPTIGGKARVKIEAGTQGGKILKLKSKGVPSLNGYQRGDQLIHINIWTPKKLTKEEEQLLNKLKESPNFTPQPEKNERSFFDKFKDVFNS